MTIPYTFPPVTVPPAAGEPARAVAPNDSDGAVSSPESDSTTSPAFSTMLGLLLTPSVPAPPATSEATPTPGEPIASGEATPAELAPARRALDLLSPDFRERLERVIDRMESEFGYKVEVVETFRTQSRQNALYAQGRTEPGRVVTWTRASNHTAGRAADVVIDGSYAGGLPYERLMRIAREEGLRTLGPLDPGHVELPTAASLAVSPAASSESTAPIPPDVRPAIIARAAPTIASLPSIAAGAAKLQSGAERVDALPPAQPATVVAPAPGARAQPRPVARVARVAGVAQVAQVAHVAQVAQVAAVAVVGGQPAASVRTTPARARPTDASTALRDGDVRGAGNAGALSSLASSPAGPSSPVARLALAASGASAGSPTARDLAMSAGPNDERSARSRTEATARESAAEVLRQARDELMHAVMGTDPASGGSSPATPGADAAAVGHADMSERIARLLKVQDAAADRPLSQVMLRLERPDGGEDRVRVDLRGTSVTATLDVSDQAAADRLGANVGELQRALERHGFDAESLTVRTTTRALESATLSRAAGASVESDLQRTTASSSPNHTSSRDRGTRHDEQRQSPDPHRQRSRREQKGDR